MAAGCRVPVSQEKQSEQTGNEKKGARGRESLRGRQLSTANALTRGVNVSSRTGAVCGPPS